MAIRTSAGIRSRSKAYFTKNTMPRNKASPPTQANIFTPMNCSKLMGLAGGAGGRGGDTGTGGGPGGGSGGGTGAACSGSVGIAPMRHSVGSLIGSSFSTGLATTASGEGGGTGAATVSRPASPRGVAVSKSLTRCINRSKRSALIRLISRSRASSSSIRRFAEPDFTNATMGPMISQRKTRTPMRPSSSIRGGGGLLIAPGPIVPDTSPNVN